MPTVIPIDFTAPDGVEDIRYDVREPIPVEHRDAEVLVSWLNPPDRLAELPSQLPRLEYIQGLMAGTDALHAAGFPADLPICSGVGLHDVPVAEHTLALMLAAARRLDETTLAQQRHEWYRPLSGNQTVKRTGFTQIAGSHVTVWGFGGIGARLGGYLRAMGAEVTGVARSAGQRHGFPVVAADELPRVLASTDVLVSVLPGTAQTESMISADVFAALPEHAWFINVGRGSVVDDGALLAALESGAIAGAALDVFRTEPLPADSRLWDAPNMIITPHSAGGRPQEPGRLIEENLRRHLAGEALLGVTHP